MTSPQKMNNIIKITLAILFLLCLLDFPYGYFQFVRFAALLGFAFLAYEANQSNKQVEMIVYIALLLMFQPFIKLSLGRIIWNVADVIVAVGLIVSVIAATKNGKP